MREGIKKTIEEGEHKQDIITSKIYFGDGNDDIFSREDF